MQIINHLISEITKKKRFLCFILRTRSSVVMELIPSCYLDYVQLHRNRCVCDSIKLLTSSKAENGTLFLLYATK